MSLLNYYRDWPLKVQRFAWWYLLLIFFLENPNTWIQRELMRLQWERLVYQRIFLLNRYCLLLWEQGLSKWQYFLIILEDFYNLFIYKRFEGKDKIEVTNWQPCLFLRFAASCCQCLSSWYKSSNKNREHIKTPHDFYHRTFLFSLNIQV